MFLLFCLKYLEEIKGEYKYLVWGYGGWGLVPRVRVYPALWGGWFWISYFGSCEMRAKKNRWLKKAWKKTEPKKLLLFVGCLFVFGCCIVVYTCIFIAYCWWKCLHHLNIARKRRYCLLIVRVLQYLVFFGGCGGGCEIAKTNSW